MIECKEVLGWRRLSTYIASRRGDILDIMEEWLSINDEWEEEDIHEQVKPYRKRSEDIKISDQNDSQ